MSNNSVVRPYMVAPRRITRSALAAAPYERWNAFVHLCFMTSYDQLTPLQRKAHLAFWYDHEVNNGGHGQYFDNRGNECVPETITALKELDGDHLAEILIEAFDLHTHHGGRVVDGSDATGQLVQQLDVRYYAAQPDIYELLKRFLDLNQDAFIEIIEEA